MPCFNEADCIAFSFQELCRRLHPLLGSIGEAWGLLLVDDGSTDETWEQIRKISESAVGIRGVRISQNVGQQAALLCGYQHADADWIVSMDCDLQEPPEAILEMFEYRTRGYEIVVSHRCRRDTDGLLKRLTAWCFYCIAGCLGIDTRALQSSELRMMSRGASECLIHAAKPPLFHRFTIFELGYPIATVSCQRACRIAGETKYTLTKMARLSWDAIWGSRTAVKRLAWMSIAIQAMLSLVAAFLVGIEAAAWAVMVISLQMLLLIGFVTSISVVIYLSVRPMPIYQVSQRCGW